MSTSCSVLPAQYCHVFFLTSFLINPPLAFRRALPQPVDEPVIISVFDTPASFRLAAVWVSMSLNTQVPYKCLVRLPRWKWLPAPCIAHRNAASLGICWKEHSWPHRIGCLCDIQISMLRNLILISPVCQSRVHFLSSMRWLALSIPECHLKWALPAVNPHNFGWTGVHTLWFLFIPQCFRLSSEFLASFNNDSDITMILI